LFEFSEFADDANPSWAVVPSEMLIHVRMSSSAKADDPVRRAVRDLSSAGDYWIPAFAGMTAVLGAFRAAKYPGPDAPICLLRFHATGRMLSPTQEKP
jgi:hypothetical protein